MFLVLVGASLARPVLLEKTGGAAHHVRGGYAQEEPPAQVVDNKIADVDTVGAVGTDAAKGGFSFAPLPPWSDGVEVSVKDASLAKLLQELLVGRKLPGSVKLVPEKVGIIEDGNLSDLVIRQASVKETLMMGGTDQVGLRVPNLTASLVAKYDVKFTSLEIPEQGRMNMTLQGGGVTLKLPSGGAGQGSCRFDASLRMTLHSTSGLDGVGGDAIDDGLKSLAAAINDNMLSLQDGILHTVERSLCTALLSGLSGDPGQATVVVGAQREAGEEDAPPAWQVLLADFGISPLGLAVGVSLCCFGWLLGACCFGTCGRRRTFVQTAEMLPLKTPEEDLDMFGCSPDGNKKKSMLNSLTCCRRVEGPTTKSMTFR